MKKYVILITIAFIISSFTLLSSSDFMISKKTDGTCTIEKYIGTNTDLIIPSDIDGYRVTEIGEGAFDETTDFESLAIPNQRGAGGLVLE